VSKIEIVFFQFSNLSLSASVFIVSILVLKTKNLYTASVFVTLISQSIDSFTTAQRSRFRSPMIDIFNLHFWRFSTFTGAGTK